MPLPETYSTDTCPTLRRGASGVHVETLQRLLARQFDDLDDADFSDGKFGPNTLRRLKEFQRLERLVDDGIAGAETWKALLRDRRTVRAETLHRDSALARRIIATLDKKRYEYFDDGRPYHLNMIGLRDPATSLDTFDDRLIVLFMDEAGAQQTLVFPFTTDPGAYYTREHLLDENGVAILVPGQYRDVYKIGQHKGYDALVQLGGEVKVWRDSDMDDQLDRFGQQFSGYYGINIHRSRAQGRTPTVGKYSAGCQVFQNAEDFRALMALAEKSRSLRGNHFTYTLLEADKLEPDPVTGAPETVEV
jgi:hypothetical protein